MTTQLAVITASVRPERFGPTITRWVTTQLSNKDAEVDYIDLADYFSVDAATTEESAGSLSERVKAADAVIVVTPEYNHSFPGPLKAAIDNIGPEWTTKPVGLVSYGGLSGGLRAVEALRLVFAEVRAITVRDVVSFHSPWGAFDEAGYTDNDEAEQAFGQLLAALLWWAKAVSNASAVEPYPN